jgi:hypothetical protein
MVRPALVAIVCLALAATAAASRPRLPGDTSPLVSETPGPRDMVRALASHSADSTGARAGHGELPGVAMGMSLLVPGLGQLHEGHKVRGLVFLGIESALWTSYAIAEVQSNLRDKAAREHAEVFAGVSSGAHSEAFYRDVAQFKDSDVYNALIRREARALFLQQETSANPPSDSLLAAFMDQYEREHGYFGTETWSWQSYERFLEYRSLRQSVHEATRRAAFSIGAALANRLFAVMDVTRGRARASQAAADPAERLGLRVATSGTGRTTCALQFEF